MEAEAEVEAGSSREPETVLLSLCAAERDAIDAPPTIAESLSPGCSLTTWSAIPRLALMRETSEAPKNTAVHRHKPPPARPTTSAVLLLSVRSAAASNGRPATVLEAARPVEASSYDTVTS